MAQVTPNTIEAGYHTGKCRSCGGQSAAAHNDIELCLACITTVLPLMLVDALEDCGRETIYQHRERANASYWQAAYHRSQRERTVGEVAKA